MYADHEKDKASTKTKYLEVSPIAAKGYSTISVNKNSPGFACQRYSQMQELGRY